MIHPDPKRQIPQSDGPWWRHGMVWLVLSGPAIVIVAGIYTLILAVQHPDPLVSDTATAVPSGSAHQPAVQARNHASTAR